MAEPNNGQAKMHGKRPPGPVKRVVNEDQIRTMIVHTLQIYPVISPTMLQNALGPWLKAKVWRPVMEQMIASGTIQMSNETRETPSGRFITYKKLQLTRESDDEQQPAQEQVPKPNPRH